MTRDRLLLKAKQIGLNLSPSLGVEQIEKAIALENFYRSAAIDPIEEEIIKFGSPMLCASITDLDKLSRNIAMETWHASAKADGVRCLCSVSQDGMRFFTRGKNVDTLRPIQYTFRQWSDEKYYFDLGILDGELVFKGDILALEKELQLDERLNTRTAAISIMHRSVLDPSITLRHQLTFVVFDCVTDEIFDDRNYFVRTVSSSFPKNFELVQTPVAYETNRQFLDRVIAEGGEGIILKNPKSKYIPGKSKAHKQWIKIKKLSGGGTDFESTTEDETDGVVIGFQRSRIHTNLIGSVIVGDEDGKEIARISGLDTNTKLEMHYHPEKWLGRKLVFTGNEKTTANDKAAHARFLRWKEAEEK